MIFLSRTGNHRVVLVPAETEYHNVAGRDGVTKVHKPGLTVEFEELTGQGGRGGIFPTLEPGKRGFRGMFDTANHQKVSRSIEEHELAKLMLAHRSYGTGFVALPEGGGDIVDPDAQFVPLSTKNGKQQWWCLLSGRTFKSTTAMKNYQKGHAFQTLLKEKDLQAQEVVLQTV